MPPLAPVLTTGAFFSGAQPALRGDGLVLRPWRETDAPAVARAFCDPAIQRWMMRTLDEAEAPAYVASRAQRWQDRTGVDFVIAEATDAAPDGGELVGRIGIHRLTLGHGLGEIAYWVAPEQRGRRIAPRALCLLSTWAFSRQGLHRLELGHSVANPASCRVAERAGFALEGTLRGHLRHADGWHDAHRHARLADDPDPPGMRESLTAGARGRAGAG